jgi:asparagine synthase (glutamine-hydrolysing)
MCGIAGILRLDPRDQVDPRRLSRMGEQIAHRGPDDHGEYVEGPVGLASRRLSIMDVSGGHMPIANEDESVWIVFNGEIYNHPQLKPALERRGHAYRTRSDTETVLHLYEEHGDECVTHLRGMFAFAIWDRRQRRLLLARDRLGIKPLYYALDDGELLFGSEIKAILAARWRRPAFNDRVLPEYLATRFVAGRETFFSGINKLLPGRTFSWSFEDGPRERRYWALNERVAGPRPMRTLEDETRELRSRLTDVVSGHLMSDVPLGVFLSGGLDSSGLAAMMAPLVQKPLRTFSVGFGEAEANELGYARLVASQLGAEHHETMVTPQAFFDALPRLVWHEDEPIAFPSSVPLYFVSRLARDHVKVVLSGEGADELFLGYNRYRVASWNARLGRVYEALAPATLQRLIGERVADLPPGVHRVVSRSFLAHGSGPRALFFENFSVFAPARQQALLRSAAHAGRDPYADVMRCYEASEGDMLDRMSRADIETYLVELLMKQDQMSMAASIESRVPFLDHELVEYVAAMPARHKLRGLTTKAVLREVFRPLVPAAILERSKMGFPTPISGWLRDAFRPLVDEFVLSPRALDRGWFSPAAVRQLVAENRAGIDNHGDRLWLLVNLEIWHRIFIDLDTPERVIDPALACASSG